MQGLSLDFELATGTATMLGLYASYKWQMGFFLICFPRYQVQLVP